MKCIMKGGRTCSSAEGYSRQSGGACLASVENTMETISYVDSVEGT